MYSVLIVDDDADHITLVRSLLIAEGYNVLVAYSKTEALEILSSDVRVDVLYTDLHLGDGLGSEILAEMSVCRPFMATVLVSGWYLMPSRRYHGFDDYLVKPSTRDLIVDTISNCAQLYGDGGKAAA